MAKQKQQIVYVERKPDKLVRFGVLSWLLGPIYWGWLVIKWSAQLITWPFRFAAKAGWKTMIEWPVRMSVAACQWTVRGTQALIERRNGTDTTH